MPVVSISLSEIGYNGYTNIPKGLRSKLVDKLLREYDLRSHSVVIPFEDRAVSVQQVLDDQHMLTLDVKHLTEENDRLITRLKELKE
jgi:hypothetical protein